VGVLLLIYWQYSNFRKDAWENFQLIHPFSLVLAVVMVVPNIWLAFAKWDLTLKLIVPETEAWKKRHSFYAGLVTGMLTPNMIGNFIGRFYYFERSKRSSIILFTLLCNYIQFLASLTFGWISVLVWGGFIVLPGYRSLFVWLAVGLILAYLIFFYIDNFLYRIRPKGYVARFRSMLRRHRPYRAQILGLGFMRYLVFTTQFSLVLHAFGEAISWESVLAIWQVYLLTMLAPSLVLGKLGVKESIALTVLGSIGMNEFAVLFSSLIIWTVNSLSPAVFGLIICKRKPHAVNL
jgi:hypothetical protein